MHSTLIVGDLGNSSLHLAEYLVEQPDGWAMASTDLAPRRVFQSSWDGLDFNQIGAWINHAGPAKVTWRIGAVNQSALSSLLTWLEPREETVRVVAHTDFSMPINVRFPERVGIDRLAAAFAANRLRSPHHAAIVVDAGTAITVDCLTAAGQFIGGTIAPGLQLCLDTLSKNTDLLPQTTMNSIPCLIGDETSQAIRSGVYWMTTQGINGLIDRMCAELASPCVVFGTGGSMPLLLPNLHDHVQHVPHLVLSGLALLNHE